MGKIKPKKSKKSTHILPLQKPPNYDTYPILFSLEHVQSGKYCHSKLDKDNRACFSDAIFKRKGLKWSEINKMGRHALGTEKLPVSDISYDKPEHLKDDFTEYLVFRYNGKAPMVGYRLKNVFYVLWFDYNFTLYNHGS